LTTVVPWEKGNIFGPKTATASKGEVVGRLIKAAKKPLMIVGAETLVEQANSRPLLSYVIELSKAAKMPVVATAHTSKPLAENGLESPVGMGVVEITDRLRDQDWSLDNKGPHDLIVLIGITYQLQSQMLSTLKHFAAHVKTVSLDRYYSPNADWSFPNLDQKSWADNLDKLMKTVKAG